MVKPFQGMSIKPTSLTVLGAAIIDLPDPPDRPQPPPPPPPPPPPTPQPHPPKDHSAPCPPVPLHLPLLLPTSICKRQRGLMYVDRWTAQQLRQHPWVTPGYTPVLGEHAPQGNAAKHPRHLSRGSQAASPFPGGTCLPGPSMSIGQNASQPLSHAKSEKACS